MRLVRILFAYLYSVCVSRAQVRSPLMLSRSSGGEGGGGAGHSGARFVDLGICFSKGYLRVLFHASASRSIWIGVFLRLIFLKIGVCVCV